MEEEEEEEEKEEEEEAQKTKVSRCNVRRNLDYKREGCKKQPGTMREREREREL
jgi:hypothetical protein